jgi:hypothetical protein
MKHQTKPDLQRMDMKELRNYLRNLDLKELKYVYVHKRKFFLFEKYYLNICDNDGNVRSIPFRKKHKEEVKKDVFTIKTLLNFKKTS